MKGIYILLALLLAASLSAQVEGEFCGGFIDLPQVTNYCSTSGEFTNSGAAIDSIYSDCVSNIKSADVWFRFRALTSDANVRVIGNLARGSGGSLNKPQFTVYSGGCGALTEISCAADLTSPGSNVAETFLDSLNAGEYYYLRIGGQKENIGSFQLCVDQFDYVPEPNSDCVDGVILCDKSPFIVSQLQGAGQDKDEVDPTTCIREEISSVWYRWTCDQPGTLSFTLTPNNPVDDLDFIVYELTGGIDDCSNKRWLRCMASGANVDEDFSRWERCSGKTGLRDGEWDLNEDPGCSASDNNYVNSFVMEAGKSYALMVNNFSNTGNGFAIEWGGTGTFLGPKPRFTVDPPVGGKCEETVFTVENKSTTTPGAESFYDWNFGTFAVPVQAAGDGPFEVQYDGYGKKIITLRLTSSEGCVVTETVELEVLECCAPGEETDLRDVRTEDPSCPGRADGSFELFFGDDVTEYRTSVDGAAYQPSPARAGLQEGSYLIAVENIKGCRDTVTLELNDPPVFTVKATGAQKVRLGESARVSAQSDLEGNYQYRWDGFDSLVCLSADCAEAELFTFNSQILTVTAVNEAGCLATDKLSIEVEKFRSLYAPNAFSPNADGVNDYWTLYGSDVIIERIVDLVIVDRWGNEVFRQRDLLPNIPELGWDGSIRGYPASAGVYAFLATVEYIDGELVEVGGDINLVR